MARPADLASGKGAPAAADGWRRLLADPGPVVVAAAQGTGCFGAERTWTRLGQAGSPLKLGPSGR